MSSTWPFLAKINVIFLQTAKFSYTNYILRYWKIATGLVHKYIEPLYNGLEPDSIYNLYSLNYHSIWKTTMTLLVPWYQCRLRHHVQQYSKSLDILVSPNTLQGISSSNSTSPLSQQALRQGNRTFTNLMRGRYFSP